MRNKSGKIPQFQLVKRLGFNTFRIHTVRANYKQGGVPESEYTVGQNSLKGGKIGQGHHS